MRGVDGRVVDEAGAAPVRCKRRRDPAEARGHGARQRGVALVEHRPQQQERLPGSVDVGLEVDEVGGE